MAEEDLQRVAQATGAQVQTTVNGLNDAALGTCAQFQEKQASSAIAICWAHTRWSSAAVSP